MAVIGFEVAKEIQHLAGLRHGSVDVVQCISESLEPGALLSDGHVTLANATKFSLEVDGALHLVVTEEALDVGLDGEGRRVRLVDGVEDRLVHGGVKPIHDTMVVHHPVAIVLGERRR